MNDFLEESLEDVRGLAYKNDYEIDVIKSRLDDIEKRLSDLEEKEN